jgi:PEP-CTERM motif
VLANYNSGTLWTQGAFHPGSTTGLADYNALLANYNVTASGGITTGGATHGLSAARSMARATASPSLAAVPAASASSGLSANPAGAAGDLHLEVNTVTGDVSVLAEGTTVAFTGYNIFDTSGNLNAGAPGSGTAELLLSIASTAGGHNTTTYRSTSAGGQTNNYKRWSAIKDTTKTVSEGQNNGFFVAGSPTTYDTINIPSGGSIDFGNIYTAAANQDLTFAFSEANANTGDPTTGSTFNGVIDYVGGSSVPEPGTLGILGLGGIMMMRRRRRVSAPL